jgi:hypothetical protein
MSQDSQTSAAQQAIYDELEGRRLEREAETIEALDRLLGLRFDPSGSPRVVARRGRVAYELDQESMDLIIEALEPARRPGDVLGTWSSPDEPPVGTKVRDRSGDRWGRLEGGWALHAGASRDVVVLWTWAEVLAFQPLTVESWGPA